MRYSSYGSLDDPPLLDGDEGFKGLNTRVEADQLTNGELSESINMRLDNGTATSRRGNSLYMSTSDSQTVAQEGLVDGIDYDSNGADDSVLFACQDKAFVYDGTLNEITYPPGDTLGPNGFLLNTRVNTLLFRGKGPTLPFNEGVELGESPLRLAKGESEFKYWKQQTVFNATYSSSGSHTMGMASGCEFVVGEKFRFHGAPGDWDDNAFEVVSFSGPNVTFKRADLQPITSAPNFTGTPCIVYSLDDQCPPADFATWAGNRLIVPTGVDELDISSPLSTHDFPITNRLVIGSGDSGDITALEPLSDDSLLVFKNHSIHAVSGVYEMKSSVAGGRLAINRITDQLGCIARKTIQIIGSDIVFLSPQGLYGLALNSQGAGAVGLPVQAVRVADIPLSRDIDNLIPGINQEDASGVFHRGRYYLFDGIEGCLVYNTLLQAWESVDNISPGVLKLITINQGSAKLLAIHGTNTALEIEGQNVAQDQFLGGSTSYDSRIKTRGYRCQSYDQKHWRRIQISWEALDNTNSILISNEITNPDSIETIYSENPVGQGSFLTRKKMGKKGESVQLTIGNNTSGRITIKRTLVEATPGSRQNYTAQ